MSRFAAVVAPHLPPSAAAAGDSRGKAVRRYELRQAWPSLVQRNGGAVPMESVTIVCEHIQRVSP
jgi:hypothetical protein